MGQTGTPDTKWYSDAIAVNPNTQWFTIANADELAGLAQIVNGTWGGVPAGDTFKGKFVRLTDDIDLSDYAEDEGWVPIGNNAGWPYGRFGGGFNGMGYVISNLTINRPNAEFQGLFGSIINDTVSNVRLENVNIIGKNFVGAVAGTIDSSAVVNWSYSTGTVSGSDGVGGVVGIISGSWGYVNGVHLHYGNSVANSYSTAAVSGVNRFVGEINGSIGGVVGSVSMGTVSNSYSTGAVSGDTAVGGVAGYVRNNSFVTNSYSTGKVSGWSSVGGIAGAVLGGSVSNCAAFNPEVKAIEAPFPIEDPDVGRVAGVNWGSDNTLSNNVAYAGMKNNAGNTTWNNKGHDNLDGADITAAAIILDGTIGGLFSDPVWTTQDGSLPGLFGNVVAMPEHFTTGTVTVQTWDVGYCGTALNCTPTDAVKATLFIDTLVIRGTGAMANFGWDIRVPWYNSRTSITNVVIENGVTSIGNHAFLGTSLTSVTIPNSVTSIGNSAFLGTSLTSVTIPNSVTSIGNGAFFGTSLTSVTIPDSVTSIGDSTFQNCMNLTSVTIPNSVISIGEWAFYNCPSLTSVVSLNNIPPTAGQYTFYNINPDACLYVPQGSIDAYSAAAGWSSFSSCINPIDTDNLVTFDSQTDGNGSLTAAVDGAPFTGGTVQAGKSIVFTAIPKNPYYKIHRWIINGVGCPLYPACAGASGNTYTHTVTGDLDISVEFEPDYGEIVKCVAGRINWDIIKGRNTGGSGNVRKRLNLPAGIGSGSGGSGSSLIPDGVNPADVGGIRIRWDEKTTGNTGKDGSNPVIDLTDDMGKLNRGNADFDPGTEVELIAAVTSDDDDDAAAYCNPIPVCVIGFENSDEENVSKVTDILEDALDCGDSDFLGNIFLTDDNSEFDMTPDVFKKDDGEEIPVIGTLDTDGGEGTITLPDNIGDMLDDNLPDDLDTDDITIDWDLVGGNQEETGDPCAEFPGNGNVNGNGAKVCKVRCPINGNWIITVTPPTHSNGNSVATVKVTVASNTNNKGNNGNNGNNNPAPQIPELFQKAGLMALNSPVLMESESDGFRAEVTFSFIIKAAPPSSLTGATVAAPAAASKTVNSITLSAVTPPANGQTVQYAVNSTNTAPASGWQAGLTFGSLNADTEYFFFARAAQNIDYKAGAASAGTAVTTAVCVHDFSVTETDVPATCTVVGKGQYKCSICGAAGTSYDIPMLTGNACTPAAVLSSDRIFPDIHLENEPVNKLAGGFTAGPNPAARPSGKVDIFRQGKSIQNGTLTVYDAYGNVINKIRINDNANQPNPTVGDDGNRPVPAGSRRIVGSWDLKDAKGRPVSEGTYLMKGVIIVDGKKERVSIVIGVK
jgi:hypothetical protein